MQDYKNFKTRLKIAKSKLKQKESLNDEKRGSFMGTAFKLGAAAGMLNVIKTANKMQKED